MSDRKLEVGTKITTQRRTITEGDFSAMVNLSWESSPIHTDDEYAKNTIFGRRVLGGPCTIPFVAGLSGHAWHGLWEKSGMRLLALVGINNIAFKAPLFANDTIWVELEIASKRPTSKPKRSIVTVRDTLKKQGGETILQMERLVLVEDLEGGEAGCR
jgi:acyl dehydratase